MATDRGSWTRHQPGDLHRSSATMLGGDTRLAMLLAELGQDFREYCRRSWRIIPLIS